MPVPGLWGPGPGLPWPATPSHQHLAGWLEVLFLGRASGSTGAGVEGGPRAPAGMLRAKSLRGEPCEQLRGVTQLGKPPIPSRSFSRHRWCLWHTEPMYSHVHVRPQGHCPLCPRRAGGKAEINDQRTTKITCIAYLLCIGIVLSMLKT